MFGAVENVFGFVLQGFYMGVILWGLGAFVEYCVGAVRSIGGGPD